MDAGSVSCVRAPLLACLLVAQMVGYKWPPRWLHLVGFVVLQIKQNMCLGHRPDSGGNPYGLAGWIYVVRIPPGSM